MKPNNLVYKKGDLFSAEAEDGAVNILLHACNCQGVWGSGVAKTFAEKYPRAYEYYKDTCKSNGTNALGKTTLIVSTESRFIVGAAFTSDMFGSFVSPPDVILDATRLALHDLENQLTFEPFVRIHSPKINSGLFKTPWEDTEKLIVDFLSVRPDIIWTVWELE